MTPKPFTPNASKKVEQMTNAANQVFSAIRALEAAQKSAEHWAEWESLGSFKHELEQFLSCDHGEAGFEPYLVRVAGKISPRTEKLTKIYNRN
jgi:hypothetical protein